MVMAMSITSSHFSATCTHKTLSSNFRTSTKIQFSRAGSIAFSSTSSFTVLTKENIVEPMKDIRRALLEADVSLPVVRRFVQAVSEQAVGVGVIRGVTPDQQLVKIVSDELLKLMGGEVSELVFAKSGPSVILLAGLQGVGKTTVCAKLAFYLKKQLWSCMVHRERVACLLLEMSTDLLQLTNLSFLVNRYMTSIVNDMVHLQLPFSYEDVLDRFCIQYFSLCLVFMSDSTSGSLNSFSYSVISLGQVDVPVYTAGTGVKPAEIAKQGLQEAKKKNIDVVIMDTAGRLQIDKTMMDELKEVKQELNPTEVLLVVDAMTGQEAAGV
ncbi:hypothetical protein C3L33_22318, partial [Rhododendron williamsianum]